MAAVSYINATGRAAGPARKVLLLRLFITKGPADKVMERLAHITQMPERRPAQRTCRIAELVHGLVRTEEARRVAALFYDWFPQEFSTDRASEVLAVEVL